MGILSYNSTLTPEEGNFEDVAFHIIGGTFCPRFLFYCIRKDLGKMFPLAIRNRARGYAHTNRGSEYFGLSPQKALQDTILNMVPEKINVIIAHSFGGNIANQIGHILRERSDIRLLIFTVASRHSQLLDSGIWAQVLNPQKAIEELQYDLEPASSLISTLGMKDDSIVPLESTQIGEVANFEIPGGHFDFCRRTISARNLREILLRNISQCIKAYRKVYEETYNKELQKLETN